MVSDKIGRFFERDTQTKRRLHTPEQIVNKLKDADAQIAAGSTVEQVCKQLGISDATYYNWRKQYGQMKLNQVRQLKAVQKENARLKKLVADLSLDKAVLDRAVSDYSSPIDIIDCQIPGANYESALGL